MTLIIGLALLIALVITLTAKPVAIEERLVGIQVAAELDSVPGIHDEPIDIQALLLDYRANERLFLKARAAMLAHPDIARKILPLYGAEPEFREILAEYGEQVLLPIYYFHQNDVWSVEVMNRTNVLWLSAKESLASLWRDSPPPSASGGSEAPETDTTTIRQGQALSPEERGWYAVNFIQQEGHDFLGQFRPGLDGQVDWITTERVVEGVSQFLSSGIRNVEVKYRAGEDLTLEDGAWLAVDLAIAGSAFKVLKAGRAVSATTKNAGVASRSAALGARLTRAGSMASKTVKYAKWPVAAGLAYVVVAHPAFISDVLAELATVLDLPAWLVQFTGWALLLAPLIYLGSWAFLLLVRPAILVLRSTIALLFWLRAKLSH
ncbi:MAG: hypothetical protein KGY54_06680 [Oleiphilaceae bacterium]|nr:hypothetical protein [Oleiphilaceae bacterium]